MANELRKKGIKTVTNLEELKFKKVFALADKKGASFVTLYGDDEKAKGEVSLKNLKTKEQENFKISDSEAIFTFLNQ